MSNNPDPEETSTVVLPESVVADIEDRLPRTRFDSVDEYAAYALAVLLREADRRDDTPEHDTDEGEEMRQRLESLGYL